MSRPGAPGYIESMEKEAWGWIAIALTGAMFIPYIRSMARGVTRPHPVSWAIWGGGTAVIFFAQLLDGAGWGAWPIGLSGAITIGVAVAAYRMTQEFSPTKTDVGCLIVAAAGLLMWPLASSPVWTVVILTAVDLVGFVPTVRLVLKRPFDENLGFYVVSAFRNAAALLALEHYSVTTVVFPAAVLAGCLMLVSLMLICRARDAHHSSSESPRNAR